MPEILEAGYFFPYYIGLFIAMALVVYGSNALLVVGLWCDLSEAEFAASTTRELALLEHARSLKKTDINRGHLARWANDLQDYADAIPDTHGLMIHAAWQGLPLFVRRQVSANHASWESFCEELKSIELGCEKQPSQRMCRGMLVTVLKKQRWSCVTSYIQSPQQPQPLVTACPINHRVASGLDRTLGAGTRERPLSVVPKLDTPRQLRQIPGLNVLGALWREACAPPYNCLCTICKRAVATAGPKTQSAPVISSFVNVVEIATEETGEPLMEILPVEDEPGDFGPENVVSLVDDGTDMGNSLIVKRCLEEDDIADHSSKRLRQA
ncbi:hypothetical protein B0H13DRAFT_1873167 [Mycena leptocephala]|nr:hypothetical protein B0H13DRAFT_1873167 [Mycena leptocephala]